MANNVDLVMRLLAEDKASAAFKKVGAEVETTGGKYTKFGKTAAAALAAVGVVKFARDSVNAYKDAEASQAKLELAYRKFPKTANVSIASLRAYNSELQKKTKYDDDDTAAMQAHLAMFDLTGKQIKDLTPLVQDLASAQGVDLATASDAVGKALLGNTRGLKSIGVEFKATGNRAKDYAAIQQLLNEKVGGFAENEGKTAAGQAAILANQWGDLQETVGGALVPALTSLVNVAKPIVETFNGLPEPIKQATIVVGALGAGFVFLVPKIAAAKIAMLEFTGSTKGAGAAGAAASTSRFSKVLGGLGKAIPVVGAALALGTIAVDLFAESTNRAAESEQAFKAALEASNGALDENVRKTVAKDLEDRGLLATARKLGIAEDVLVDAVMGDARAKELVAQKTREAITAGSSYAANGRFVGTAMNEQAQSAQQLQRGLSQVTGALDDSLSSQRRLNNAMGASAAQVASVQKSWERLRVAMRQPINGSVRITVRANGNVSINGPTGGGQAVIDNGRAAGGYMRAGQVSKVGEFGPELFVAPRSGRIMPASSTAAMGGSTATIVVPLYLDNRKVAEGQVELKRRNGGVLPYM